MRPDASRYWDEQRKVSVYNASDETVPPYGVMRIKDTSNPRIVESQFVWDIIKPNRGSELIQSVADHIINGPMPIRPKKYGFGTMHLPALAVVTDLNEDAFFYTEQGLGPGNSFILRHAGFKEESWYLHYGRSAYGIAGNNGVKTVNGKTVFTITPATLTRAGCDALANLTPAGVCGVNQIIEATRVGDFTIETPSGYEVPFLKLGQGGIYSVTLTAAFRPEEQCTLECRLLHVRDGEASEEHNSDLNALGNRFSTDRIMLINPSHGQSIEVVYGIVPLSFTGRIVAEEGDYIALHTTTDPEDAEVLAGQGRITIVQV